MKKQRKRRAFPSVASSSTAKEVIGAALALLSAIPAVVLLFAKLF